MYYVTNVCLKQCVCVMYIKECIQMVPPTDPFDKFASCLVVVEQNGVNVSY